VSETKQELGAGAGSRVRQRRLDRGIKQGELARRLGISAAYLNLIEHDRRRIGGKLLSDAARALEVEPSALIHGAAGALLDDIRSAAALGGAALPADERARADIFAQSFPGWAGLVAAQARRIAELDRAIQTLSDRLTHDPFLSESIHEVLTSVTAIQSTAAILKDHAEIDPEWRQRFHRNMFEDSVRLTDSAQTLVGYLDAGDQSDRAFATPQEEAEAWLDAHGWHIPRLEDCAPGDIDTAVANLGALPNSSAGRALVWQAARRYAADARLLPFDPFRRAIDATGPDPMRLAQRFDVDPLTVFRRIAAMPDNVVGPVGLVLCDGSGTLTFRRPVPGFPLPRYGAGCPLWPLFQALSRPMQPIARPVEMTGRLPRRFRALALARPVHPGGFAGPEIVEAAMLLFEAQSQHDGPFDPVGASCRICARDACPARREPSMVSSGGGDLAETATFARDNG